jgi:hypothetical protein
MYELGFNPENCDLLGKSEIYQRKIGMLLSRLGTCLFQKKDGRLAIWGDPLEVHRGVSQQ